MARIKKTIRIGYGGVPSIYLVELGKKDMPSLELKQNPSKKLEIKTVKCMMTPSRSSMYAKDWEPVIEVLSVENSVLKHEGNVTKKGKMITPSNRLDIELMKYRIPNALSEEDKRQAELANDVGIEYRVIRNRLSQVCEQAIAKPKKK